MLHYPIHPDEVWTGTDGGPGWTLQGVKVEVELRGSRADWLEGPKLAELCSCFGKPSGPRLTTEGLILEDQTVEKRCYKAFNAVKVCASLHLLSLLLSFAPIPFALHAFVLRLHW